MTADETVCFKVLDSYARTRHNCFLAEMNPSKSGYLLCFRPAGGTNVELRYECRYLVIPLHEMHSIGSLASMPASVAQVLDSELFRLPRF
jgi:hypothetical protein